MMLASCGPTPGQGDAGSHDVPTAVDNAPMPGDAVVPAVDASGLDDVARVDAGLVDAGTRPDTFDAAEDAAGEDRPATVDVAAAADAPLDVTIAPLDASIADTPPVDGSTADAPTMCAPGLTRSCYGGPGGTRGVGRCRGGLEVCDADAGWSGECVGEQRPEAERCNGLDDDCDGQTDEDFPLTTDAMNCGACGVVCPAGFNGAPTCVGGRCALRCAAVRGDCDGDLTNGCEAALAESPNHCGACGVRCVVGCTDGTCVTPVSITSAHAHSCARMSNNTVRCWGSNFHGELGSGGPQVLTPRPVAAQVRDAIEVTSANGQTFARLRDGNVVGWGTNGQGALGDGTTIERMLPVPITGLVNITSLTAGSFSGCARSAEGFRCWGDDVLWNRPSGSQPYRLSPALTPALSSFDEIAFGDLVACALAPGGQVSCWGDNSAGQLGVGSTGRTVTAPQVVPGLSQVAQVAAGSAQVCARTAAGETWCWGNNAAGQVGDGTTTNRPSPTRIEGLESAVLSVRQGLSCAVDRSGAAWCWGLNDHGQIGDGTHTSRTRPQRVVLPGRARTISAGNFHACALLETGEVYCWGRNYSGQLGDGTFDERPTPVQVRW